MPIRPQIDHPNDAADDPGRRRRRRRSLASTYSRDEAMERLLALRAQADTNPVARDRIEGLLPEVRMSLGHYENAREAALVEGLIDESGAAR